MYPEAGGSSSFARHAFNELWSFFAAWAQMLNYTITIAISAFFVPHYLGGLFWPALRHGPGDVLFGIAVVVVLSVVNVVGVKEAAGLNIVLGDHRPRDAAAAGDRRRRARALAASAARQRPPRRRAVLEKLPRRDPDRDDRLYGHRDDLQHGRGGARRDAGPSRARSGSSCSPCSRSTPRCRWSRCRRCRFTKAPTAATRRCSAPPRTRAASPATPCWGSSSTCTSARCSRPVRSTSGCSRRRSCSSPPKGTTFSYHNF